MDAILGKLATTAIEQAAKESAKVSPQSLEGGESPFKQMLDSMGGKNDGVEFAKNVGIGENSALGSGDLNAISAENIKVDPTEMKVGADAPQGTAKVVDMLSDVNKGQMQMDNLVNEVLYSGKKFSNQELLVIQAHMYHFAEMTSLTVKVTEQGVGSVKTVLNTQIQ